MPQASLYSEGDPSREGPADSVVHALSVLRNAPFTFGASREQERACAVLFSALMSVLRTTILRYSLSEDEVADALHDKFLELVTDRVQTLGPTKKDFQSFVYVVGVNALKNVIRARNRRELREVLLPDDLAAIEATALPRLECVQTIIQTLQANDQILVCLKADGYSGDEIATRLGIDRNAVDQRWHRIKLRLRRECKGKLDD